MSTTLGSSRSAPQRSAAPLRASPRSHVLKHGDRMDAVEFMRRYEHYDEDTKAELIDGEVYMFTEFVTATWHGVPDGLIQYWMSTYGFETDGLAYCPNTTVQLGIKNVPQPDALLRNLPEFGGKTSIDGKGCIVGPVEFVAEIASTTEHFDLGKKLEAYRDSGVQEYLVWSTKKDAVSWWYLDQGVYVLLPKDESGVIRSRVFPGLWLDVGALLKRDGKAIMATLRKGLKSAEYKKFSKRKAK